MPTISPKVGKPEIEALRTVLTDWAQALRGDAVNPGSADTEYFQTQASRAEAANPWFTQASILRALEGLAHMLRGEAVDRWLAEYPELRGSERQTHRVGIVAAGNVPMVGFHDVLTTMAAGHRAVVKLSHQDEILLPALFKVCAERYTQDLFPVEWAEQKLEGFDAVIATGSNNTSRYFHHYFGKYPHVIRKNRSSVAILSGEENEAELHALGEDFFAYFGLGCRNVSKIYVPEGFDLDRLFGAIYPYNDIINHHKYANNYDYHKATWLLDEEKLLDNGFVLFRESTALGSPVGSVYYERYTDEAVLRQGLAERSEEIQCMVSGKDIAFGKSQKPELWDYADGVDTMRFFLDLQPQ